MLKSKKKIEDIEEKKPDDIDNGNMKSNEYFKNLLSK
jgi:hypothetical protein